MLLCLQGGCAGGYFLQGIYIFSLLAQSLEKHGKNYSLLTPLYANHLLDYNLVNSEFITVFDVMRYWTEYSAILFG
jgi:hypothetical protein